jgi:hypothetical protein
MPTLTNDQLAVMNFGYLTGADLMQYSSVQVLIKQYEVNQGKLQMGCDNAQSEMIGLFATKYDLMREYTMISGPRQQLVVKLTAILAVRDILGNMAGIGDVTRDNFVWADDIIERAQNGTFNLPLYAANCKVESNAFLVRQNFRTWG